MIRHSSSFFISLIIHTFVALMLFYTYKTVFSSKEEKNEKVELKLSYLVEKKELKKAIEKPAEILKSVPSEPQKKPVIQKTIKKTTPPKEKPRKLEAAVKEIKKEEVKQVEQTPVKEVPFVENIQERVQQEQSIAEKKSSPETEYINENIQRITELLQEHLYYPRSARKRGITGEVIVSFTLHTDATADSIKTISSESDILSRAAIKTIEDLSGEFPKPKKMLILSVPIRYSLSH